MIQQVEITPAEIAEHLMRNEDADLALKGIVDLLEEKKEQQQNEHVKEVPAANGDGKKEKRKNRNFWKCVNNIKFARQFGKENKM